MNAKIVEVREEEGMYGFDTTTMIIDTKKHGRVLITDGWGGDDLSGYCYRWIHGIAVQLKDDDDFDVLDADWNDWTTTLGATLEGADPERPILQWTGYAINKLANAAK